MQNTSAIYEKSETGNSVSLSIQERSTSFLASIVSASGFGETSCGKREREVCFLHHASC